VRRVTRLSSFCSNRATRLRCHYINKEVPRKTGNKYGYRHGVRSPWRLSLPSCCQLGLHSALLLETMTSGSDQSVFSQLQFDPWLKNTSRILHDRFPMGCILPWRWHRSDMRAARAGGFHERCPDLLSTHPSALWSGKGLLKHR